MTNLVQKGPRIDPRRLQNRPWRLQNRLPEAPKSTPEAPVGTSWAIVGHLGAILDHLGVNLGSFWAHLGSSWGHFEWNSELFLNKCCCVWSSRSFFLQKGRTSKFATIYSTFEGFSCLNLFIFFEILDMQIFQKLKLYEDLIYFLIFV